MKRTTTTEYISEGGMKFATAAECKAYEEIARLSVLLSGHEPYRITEALERADIDLADAFERAGAIIAAKRRANGDLKRARKPKTPLAESASKLNAAMRAQGASR